MFKYLNSKKVKAKDGNEYDIPTYEGQVVCLPSECDKWIEYLTNLKDNFTDEEVVEYNKIYTPASISEVLNKLLKETNTSPVKLAEALDVSIASVMLWLSGDRFPNKNMREKICEYFKVESIIS